MNREINYPIKYAVLELKERGGFLVGYQDITQGFIASKCYVVGSSIKYKKDGSCEISHSVVFPFKDIEMFKNSLRNGRRNISEKVIPKYNACDNIYPVDIVSNLFDSYEKAKMDAINKNEEFKSNLVMETPAFWSANFLDSDLKKQYESLIQKFNQNLEICNIFEELVSEATLDMEISRDKSNEREFVRILKPRN